MSAGVAAPRWTTVTALGLAQTLAWASSYYLPAMLAAPMAREFGISTPAVFAAFSTALVVSALVGPFAGALIDRFGGRPVLLATNLVFAAGLAGLGIAPDAAWMVVAWLVLGVGMGAGLYEAAFAALVRLWRDGARGAITGITLFAGFASTVGWPLSTLLEAELGWRGACLVWAAFHVVIGMPLNAVLPRTGPPEAPAAAVDATLAAPSALPATPRRAGPLLAFVFAATWFASTAMAAHLPQLLQGAGLSLAAAVAVGALVGPAQVAARLFEFGLLRRLQPFWSARAAALLHPFGAALLFTFGAPAAALFGLLHGAGNGILTIAKGTLPLALFGSAGYGRLQGLLMVPARIAQASAPWLFGLALDRYQLGALAVTAGLGLMSVAALALLPSGSRAPQT